MRTRQEYEQIEEEILAPYGMKSGQSRGRAYADDEHEYRTAFQKDRDRILHTTAFRRLEYKTQVFINYEGDYYRTRLTHTLEAAQIGRTIARALRLNEELTEAITLAHDLGHTPFGHSGEEVLNELMAEYGGFNHNEQTLRIVTELEQRYPDFPGLNLTWEVREGIVKHETDYDYVEADYSEYEPHLSPTLEAQVVNYCDEIAYNTHDLDDGLRSGILAFEQVEAANLALWEEGRALVDAPWGELTRHRLIRKLINMLVTDLLEETERRLEDNDINSLEAVREYDGALVSMSAEMQEKTRELKRFLYENMYRHYRVMRMAFKSRQIVEDLFNAYVSDPYLLPGETQERIGSVPLHRAVADYIAGMTDRYALQERDRLFDPWERT